MVCGHGAGVERYSADEREPGRAAARPHSGGNAETRVFRAQYVSVFTIPIGYALGGVLVDRVFEPLMAAAPPDGLAAALLGTGKGSGAALLFAALWALGVTICLLFRRDQAIRRME